MSLVTLVSCTEQKDASRLLQAASVKCKRFHCPASALQLACRHHVCTPPVDSMRATKRLQLGSSRQRAVLDLQTPIKTSYTS
ncbi:hypothetical protein GN956_G8173 [Arapaima gigas]